MIDKIEAWLDTFFDSKSIQSIEFVEFISEIINNITEVQIKGEMCTVYLKGGIYIIFYINHIRLQLNPYLNNKKEIIAFLKDELNLQIMSLLFEEKDIDEYKEDAYYALEQLIALPKLLKSELLDILQRLKNINANLWYDAEIVVEFKQQNIYLELLFEIYNKDVLQKHLAYNKQILKALEKCYLMETLIEE